MIPGDSEYTLFCFPCILFSPSKIVKKKVCFVSSFDELQVQAVCFLSFLGVLAAAVCVCVRACARERERQRKND
jgi:hypothetical protein